MAIDKLRDGFPDIALIGKMGSGKTTAANLLVEQGWERMAFAGLHPGGLRDVVSRIWGNDALQDREKLVAIGEAARAVDPYIWIHNLERALDERPLIPIVVDDARTVAELRGLQARNFLVIRVETETWRRIDRLKATGKWQNEGQLYAPTEVALDGIHIKDRLTNNSSFADFKNDLWQIIAKERSRRA